MVKARCPYLIKKAANLSLLKKLKYDNFAVLIEKYDIVATLGENMYVPVREHYACAPYHHRKDLELVEKIIKERYPDMTSSMEKYLSGTVCYFGNIYIMKRQVFFNYCSWLFPILEEFDRRADLTTYSTQELRVNGYLAERLFGIWLTYNKGAMRVCELPRIHFESTSSEYVSKKIINSLLPPSSRIRAIVKKRSLSK